MKKLLIVLYMGIFALTHVPSFAAEQAPDQTKKDEKAKQADKKPVTEEKKEKKKRGGCG